MAKIQLESDNINPFGGLFSIFNQFDRCGLRSVIDEHLGKRGSTKAAFTHGDVFASMFGSYLCGGDCIEEVMDIKPFWDNREDIRVCSSDVILRTLRNLSEDILKTVAAHCEHFYIRENNCHSRSTEFMEHTDWTECRIGGQQCGVAAWNTHEKSGFPGRLATDRRYFRRAP